MRRSVIQRNLLTRQTRAFNPGRYHAERTWKNLFLLNIPDR
jgi:hypothetical protein